MMDWLDGLMIRLGRFPTTQGRVVFTLLCVLATTVRYLGFGVPYRLSSANIPVVDGWGYWLMFLGAMSGLDVAAFASKRLTDTGYAAAKNQNAIPGVTVEAPAQVTVQQSAAPVAQPLVQQPSQPTPKLAQGEAGE
jgi:hypothetical protein